MSEEPDYREIMRQRKAEDEKKNGRMGALLVVGLVAAVGGCVTLTSGGGDDEPSAEDLTFDARRVCHGFIDDRLRSPGSSDFEETSEMDVTQSGATYVVRGKVDAQNGFGATVRSNYTCTVRSVGSQWRLESITGLG